MTDSVTTEDDASMSRSRFHLLDSRIVEKTTNAELTVGKASKDNRNPLFEEDQPWELRFDNLYPNVIFDEEERIYKCWYSPFIADPGSSKIPYDQRDEIKYPAEKMGRREMGVCYAVSKDGIKWEKPLMTFHEWEGKCSNIVIRGPHGAGVFKDICEEDPSRRYKMIFQERVKKKLSATFSADGVKWSEPVPYPEIAVVGDTHNNAFWAPTLGKYVLITRNWERHESGGDEGIRLVTRSESDDFKKWSSPENVFRGLEDHLQIYSMPVFYLHGIYIGLPSIYNIETDRVHTELAWSPDTVHWQRISPGSPLIANSEPEGDYDWGCVYAGACPVFRENEIRLYYGGSDGLHSGWRKGSFCLATLRPDGFAGYEQTSGKASALIMTAALPYRGQPICLSADVEEGGYVWARFLGEGGVKLSRSQPLRETVSDGKVEWPNGFVPHAYNGKTIRLEFELNKAKLYSFSFDEMPV